MDKMHKIYCKKFRALQSAEKYAKNTNRRYNEGKIHKIF